VLSQYLSACGGEVHADAALRLGQPACGHQGERSQAEVGGEVAGAVDEVAEGTARFRRSARRGRRRPGNGRLGRWREAG
jgi:hypothetical protein